MRPSFRISFLVSLVAHLALFVALGLSYASRREPDTGAALVAVEILPEEVGERPTESPAAEPSREPSRDRVSEVRPVFAPRATVTPPSRAHDSPADASRAPVHAARPRIQPRAQADAPAVAHAQAPLLLPGPVAANAATPQLSAALPTVEENVKAGPAPRGAAGDGSTSRPQADTQPGPGEPFVRASLLTECKPIYPRYCRLYGEQGTVILDVEIGANGTPGRVTVVVSSGHTRLDDAAAEALRKASFVPAKRDGQAVASVKRIAVAFRLKDSEEDGGEE